MCCNAKITKNVRIFKQIYFIESYKVKDTVIDQSITGNIKRNDNLKIVFSYGEEIETTEVKDLKGLSLFQTTTYLKRYGIKYNIEYIDYEN